MDLITTLCLNSYQKFLPTETHILEKLTLKNSDAKKYALYLLIMHAMFYLFIYVFNILKSNINLRIQFGKNPRSIKRNRIELTFSLSHPKQTLLESFMKISSRKKTSHYTYIFLFLAHIYFYPHYEYCIMYIVLRLAL